MGARNIAKAYKGQVTYEQLMQMPFDRMQDLYNEILSRIQQHNEEMQRRKNNDMTVIYQTEIQRFQRREVAYQEEIGNLKQSNNDLQKRLDILEVRRERVNRMDHRELKALKQTMQDKIRLIEEAENRLFDNKCKCIACIANDKCVLFDGCDHIALCQECEDKMEIKHCPICRTEYSNIKILKFC